MLRRPTFPGSRIHSVTKRRIVSTLLGWYKHRGRSLPWRHEPGQRPRKPDPYRILVSEIMLQQTQVSRVLEKYPVFLRRFHDFDRLAAAKRRDVLIAWQGMGYNNRAVRLHRLAGIVVSEHGGNLPPTRDALLQLPGVGQYTANAVLLSAFGKTVPVVDVNIRRVLSRTLHKMSFTHETIPEGRAWEIAEQLLPRNNAYDWTQALMDLGSTVCTARTPLCGDCPLSPFCASAGSMRQSRKRIVRTEPTRRNIPNRIHRGRIVEQLRCDEGRRGIAVSAVARSLGERRDSRWLAALLLGLQKDGIVSVRGDGPMHQRRVVLA